jgi:hypothetical protein
MLNASRPEGDHNTLSASMREFVASPPVQPVLDE